MKEYSQSESWRAVQRDIGLLGDSDGIRQLIETIEQIAPTDISVLITGESGTGKELVARAIHTRSKRRDKPLITVNSGAIPEGILESELFGHEKGSFTGAVGPRKGYFELADGGTIFLDEIGDLPMSIQVKLLRVLEGREFMRVGGTAVRHVDVRFITATNKNLEAEVNRGNFREDLFYRLNAMHVHVPGLRERPEDIPILANKFAADFCRENHIEFEGFAESAIHYMQQYPWPGNIRELRNVVEKIIVMERGARVDDFVMQKYLTPPAHMDTNLPMRLDKPKEEVEREFLLHILLEIKSEIAQLRELFLSGVRPQYHLGPWKGDSEHEYIDIEPALEKGDSKSKKSVSDMEKNLIKETLIKAGGNKRKTAKMLGLSERTLYRRINRYGLRDNDE